jgi:Sulfate permease family
MARWIRFYQRRWLRGDLIAGIAIAALIVPKKLGYAGIAEIPVQIERYRLTRTIDPRLFYPTIESAIAAFCDETGAGWPPTRAQPRHGPLQFIR